MPLPLLGLVGAWGLKHLAAYQVGALYGWPRLYRRLAEYSTTVNGRKSATDVAVRRALAGLFRSPGTALQTLENNVGLLRFLGEVEERVSAGKPSAPIAVMLTLVRNTKAYKHMARVREIHKQHEARHPKPPPFPGRKQ